jgi:hypothetical protein
LFFCEELLAERASWGYDTNTSSPGRHFPAESAVEKSPPMCDVLPELRQSVSRYAAGFDAALLSGEQAQRALAEAAAIERMVGVVKAMAADRMAECRAWKGAGERSAASHLARSTGSSTSDAAQTLETGRRLKDLPVLDAAARAGELSGDQTAAIADAASADPSAEERLVKKAKESSLAELRAECAKTKANACPDLEARRKKIHADRFLRDWTDREGAWHLRMMNRAPRGAMKPGGAERAPPPVRRSGPVKLRAA